MKKLILCFGVLLLLVACSDTSADEKLNYIPGEELTKIELIDDSNRDFIGKEMMLSSAIVKDAEPPTNDVAAPEESIPLKIPENPIIHSLANDQVLPGSPIQEIQMDEGKTPELIFPNGATGVFSKGNGEGIPCKKGDKITWMFEKYPLNSGRNQALFVGYVKDGIMYEAQIFGEELSGTYQLDAPQNGMYHIYFINMSSDPISLKEGQLLINNQNQ